MMSTSAGQLTTYADTLLTASQAVYGSGASYAADFNQVLDALQGVTGNTDELTQSFVSQQTQNTVTAINNSGQGVRNEIALLRREMQQMIRSLAA